MVLNLDLLKSVELLLCSPHIENVNINSVYLLFLPVYTPRRKGETRGNLRRRGLSESSAFPSADLLPKAQNADLHFCSVRLVCGSDTQRP